MPVISDYATQYTQIQRASKSGAADAWFDGNFSIASKVGSNYTAFSADGELGTVKTVGPITDLAAAATVISMTTGQPAGTSYIGGGPSVLISGSTWAMIVHLERWPGGNSGAFYGSLGLCKSTDDGASWTCLGEVLNLHYAFDNGSAVAQDIDGGPLVPNGLYYYLYYREYTDATTTYVSVARCLISTFNAAMIAGTVPTFDKWQGGASWGGSTTGTSVGCDLRWIDVWKDTGAGYYLAVGVAPPLSLPAKPQFSLSTDGLVWTVPVDVEPVTSGGTYCGLVPATITGIRSGTSPWTCVYLQGTRWSAAEVRTRTVQLEPPPSTFWRSGLN